MNCKYWLGCLLLSLTSMASSGCVCGPYGGAIGGGACSSSAPCASNVPHAAGAWDSGRQPLRSLIANASCGAGCGEVYVDEWLNEPPTVDNCGFDCGGCGSCRQCQPIRTALRLLWGTPYHGGCSSGYSDAGDCDTVPNFHGPGVQSADCNCGHAHDHAAPLAPHAAPMMSPPVPVPSAVPEAAEAGPSTAPTPAPSVTPSSVRRLNPARNRATYRTASARVN